MNLPHGNCRYDWNKWLNGEEHTAIQGVDFKETMSVADFQKMLHSKAGQQKLKVKTRSRNRTVVFKFTPISVSTDD